MFLVMSMDSGRRTRIGRLAASGATLENDLTKLALYTPDIIPRRICAGGGFDALDMTSTPKCSCGRSGAAQQVRIWSAWHARNLPDTPPVDVSRSRQVSWLAGRSTLPAAFPKHHASVTW